MIELTNGATLSGYSKINVILGKNGSGKSTLLRQFDTDLQRQNGCVRYITPERGGSIKYEGNIETNRSNNPHWLNQVRRNNQFERFRESSVSEFRNLETLVLRSIERDPEIRRSEFTFAVEIEKINSVLDRVELRPADGAGFEIFSKRDGVKANSDNLSSGESELVSLAIEILYFAYLCKQEAYAETENWLLLDEPDVHLHPDLQDRLMRLLWETLEGVNGSVIIATHSTVVLSSLSHISDDIRVGFKRLDSHAVQFRLADEPVRKVLPMFGAHPLSNVFNERPPLIVEGEDDDRIWQTVVRSSQNRISLYPCVAGDIQSISGFETAARELIESVYDDAAAFSLCDRDETTGDLEDLGPVVRCKLACRNAENLIVTDDVLDLLGTDWPSLEQALVKWIDHNVGHSRYADAVAFRDSNWDRNSFQLKGLRMLLIGLTGSDKPWEVAVGQAIARLHGSKITGEHSLREYLGEKTVEALGLLTPPPK